MPLYEYRCDKCGRQFEVIEKFSDAPLTTHEQCGGHVERLISASALQFKGSGWYITDYAKGGGEKAKDGGEKPADNGSDKKADKPAAPASSTGSDAGSSSTTPSTSKPQSTSSSSEKK